MGFWEITKKDLKLLLRDRRTAALLVVLPLVFITIIGLTTGKLLGWKRSNQMLRIGFVDDVDYLNIQTEFDDPKLDAAERTRAKNLVRKIVNGLQAGQGVEIFPAENRDTLQRMLDGQADEEVNAGLVFGPEFYRKVSELTATDVLSPTGGKLQGGLKSLDIELVSDRPESSTSTVIERLVYSEALRNIAPSVFCRSGALAQRIRSTCDDLEAEGGVPPMELEPVKEEAGQADGRLYDELVPGWTVMFVFFLINIMARSFIHERDLGTLNRLRIAPVSPTGVMFGKTVPFFIVSVVQTVLLFLAGRLLFGMSWGQEPWLLVPVILATSMSATTLGLMVATVVKTDSQVSAYATSVMIVMAGISGCFLPRDWLPDMMKTISLGTPHAWALMAYREILTTEHPLLEQVFKYCSVLVGFSGVYFLFGAWRFRHVG